MAYSNYGGIQDQIRRKREEEERRKRLERERLQAIAARQAGQKLMEEQRRKKEADTKGKKKAEPANKKKEQGKPASSVLDKKDEAEKKKSPETQIKAPPVATGPRNIKWGSRGEDVKEMQSGLVKQGYDIGPFGPLKDGIDGIVGRFTNKGIRDFQRDHGLQVDGIFGPESRAKLEEVLLDSSMDKEYAHIDLSKYGYDASKVSPEDQNMLRRAIGMQQKYGSVEMGELVEKKGAKAILDEQEANKGKYEALAEEKLQLEGLLDEQRLGLTGYYDPKTGSFMSGSADPDMPAGYWDQEGNYIPTGYQSKENRRQLQNYYAMQGTERRLRQIAAEMAALGGTDTEGVDPTSYDTRKLDDAYAKQQLDFRKAEPALWEDYTKGLEPVEDETGEGAAEPQVTARGIHPLDINMGRLAAGDRAYIKELEQAQRPPVDTGNPSFDEALVNGFRGKTIDASKIPNKATFARDNIDDIRFATYMSGQKINKQGSSLQDYTYMTDEEVDTYTALLNAEGVERADAYFASLSDRIAQRKGEHQAGVFSELSAELPGVGVPLQLGTTVLGAAAKNVQNLGRVFGGDIFPTDTEYTLSGITSDLAQKGPTVNIPGVGPMKLGAVAADIAYNTGNMLPSILVNSFLPGVGAVEMGVSAGASEYAEQFLSGNMTQSQARAMGLMSGTVETIMEKLLGLPMAGGGKLLGNFTSMGGGIANPILRRLGQVGIESLGEFAEEYTTENLNKWMEKLAKGEQLRPDDWQWTSPEAIYSGLMGLITGAMFSGGQAVKTGLDSRSVGRDVKAGMLDYTQGDLVDFGMGQDSGSRAYRLAQQIAEAGGEASPMALGDLFFEAAGAGYEVQTETEPTRYEEETGMQAEAMEDTYTEPQQAVDEDVRYTVDEMPDELAPVEETIGREPIPARQEVTARDAGRVAAEATVPTPEQIAEAETATEAEGDADWFDDWQTKMRRAALEAAAEQEARKATQTGQGAAAEARTGAEALAHLAASEAPVQARQSIPEATQARVQAIEDKNVRRLFDQGVQAANDATRYADSFVRLHDSALSGITFEQAQESAPAMIEAVGDTTARLIFEYGNLENRQRIARRENLKAEALSEARRVKDEAERVERETPVPLARFEAEGQDQGPGVYYDTGVKEAGVTAETRRQLDILDGMADRYGVRIVVTDKLPGDVNGMYDPDQGDVIYISADATDGALAAFAQHELTHYLQESSPEDYGLLRDTVVDALRDGGMDIEARVKYFTDRGLTEDAAIDEIVANGMMSTLSDPDTVTRIVETSPSLAQRIRAWLNDLINSITESISRLGRRTGQSEVAFMEQNRVQLQQVFDMFDDALERTRDQRAGQAALEAQTEADVGTEVETEAPAEARVQYSMKDEAAADSEAEAETGAEVDEETEYIQRLADLEREDRENVRQTSKDYWETSKEAKALGEQLKQMEAAHETVRARLSKDIRAVEERLSKAQTKLAEARATVRETQKALETEQKARAKDAAKIAKLQGELDTATRALKDAEKRFKAETDALVKASQRANAEMQKQLKKAADLREHAARLEERRIAREIKSKALKEKYQTLTSRHRKAELERKAKAKEKTKASVMRTRVTKSAMELRKWLAQPTDQNHVPAFMQQAVAGALDLIDMMGRTPEKGPNKGITRTTKRGRGWRESIRVLKESIEQVVNNNSALNDRYQDIVDRLDPDLLPNLEDLVKSLTRDAATGAKHNLSDLSSSQLAQLDKILKGIRAISRNATKIYRNAQFNDIRDLGNATIAEVGKKKQRTRHGLISRFLRWDQADSFTAFAAMGKSAETVQAGLFKGQEQAFKRVRSAQEFISQLRRDLGVSKSAIRNWSEQARTVTLESGAKRVMTVGQMMELYNLWQRTDTENARNHIMKGGIKLPPAKEGLGRTRAQRAIKLTEGDMDIIIGQLTDTQRRFADEMRQYLSTEVSSWGNETSMELYLYEKFTENNYWPIKSSREVLSTKGDESNMMFNALKNMGFTKSLQTGANNTIDIGDAMQTFTDHVSQMAVYNGMAAPMQDALSWLNYRQYDENGNRVTSLKQELGMVFGPEAERYVKNFFRNVNGMSTGDFGTEIANKALGRFRASAVAGSFRVMIQQPTAIVRAMSMINPRHFVATKFGRRTVAEMERWAPIAWWKMNGGYEVGLGHSMRETIIGDASVLDSAKTKMMAGAQHMDRWAWANLWDACKRETKAKNKGIDTKSDAFFQKVADRFTEVINETQVVDSIFHRSQMMRSRDNLARMATSFMAEPTRAYNMIYRAAVRGNKGQVATSVVAFAASTALNAAVKGLWDALRKRDEDDEYWEQFREYAIQSFTDDINPLGMVPYVKDVWEIIQGWTTERTDMSPYEDIINASRALLSFYEGKGGKSEYQVWATFTKAASAFTGVPLKGMLTSIEGGINALKPGMLIYRSKRATDNYATLYEYMRDGKTTDAKALRERLQTNVSKGDTPKNRYGQTPQTDRQIDAGIANIMAFGVTDENGKVTIEPDKRIAEAYKMRQNGDIVKLKELREKVKKEGFTEEMFDEAVVKYANAQVEKAEGTKATTLDTQLIKYADMVPAFEKALDGKGLADFEAALEEIMRDSNAKDKDKTMKTQVTTHIKPLYKEAYVAGDTERMKKIRDTLKAAGFEYTDKDFKEWVKEKAGAELFKMIDARESPENIKKEVQRQKDAKHYKNNSAMLKDLNAEYEEKYKDLYFSGLNGNEKDAERARALKKALQDTGLTNYAGDEAFRDDWIAQHWESDEAYAKWLEKPKSRYKVSGTQSE